MEKSCKPGVYGTFLLCATESSKIGSNPGFKLMAVKFYVEFYNIFADNEKIWICLDELKKSVWV